MSTLTRYLFKNILHFHLPSRLLWSFHALKTAFRLKIPGLLLSLDLQKNWEFQKQWNHSRKPLVLSDWVISAMTRLTAMNVKRYEHLPSATLCLVISPKKEVNCHNFSPTTNCTINQLQIRESASSLHLHSHDQCMRKVKWCVFSVEIISDTELFRLSKAVLKWKCSGKDIAINNVPNPNPDRQTMEPIIGIATVGNNTKWTRYFNQQKANKKSMLTE